MRNASKLTGALDSESHITTLIAGKGVGRQGTSLRLALQFACFSTVSLIHITVWYITIFD